MKPGDLVITIKDVHMRNLRNTHVEIIPAGTISLLVKKNVADGRVHVLIGDNMYETFEDFGFIQYEAGNINEVL